MVNKIGSSFEGINIAVVGLGYMGQNHTRVFSSMPNVNLTAVCDIDELKVQKLVKQYKIAPYSDYKKLLEDEKLDAVSICLPTILHFEAVKLAITKRIPVFVEKPICENVLQAKKLINLAARFKTPIMVGHIERFNPVVSEIKHRIDSKELGKIFLIQTERFSPPLVSDPKVPVTVDLATHDIDIIFYLLDGQVPKRIKAEVDSIGYSRSDLVTAVVRFKKGVVGVVQVSWVHPVKKRLLTVLGEKGMYVANYITQELFFYRQNRQLFKEESFLGFNNRADVTKISFESKEPLQVELEAFVESLKKKQTMPVSAGEGLRVLQVAYEIERLGKA